MRAWGGYAQGRTQKWSCAHSQVLMPAVTFSANTRSLSAPVVFPSAAITKKGSGLPFENEGQRLFVYRANAVKGRGKTAVRCKLTVLC